MTWQSPFPEASPFAPSAPVPPRERGRHVAPRAPFELPSVPLTADTLADAADQLPIGGTYAVVSVDALLTSALVTLGALERGVASPSPVNRSDVEHAHFAIATDERGYDAPSVDALVAAIAASLPDTLPDAPPAPAEPAPLTFSADQLRAEIADLPRVKFGHRYDAEAVDAFFTRAVDALQALEAGEIPDLTPQEVLEAKFSTTRFREGYADDPVDDLLDKVLEQLRAAA